MTTLANDEAGRDGAPAPMLDVLQAATRVLAGVALRSLDMLGGAVSLPQFRVLAVLAQFGPSRSGQVARSLGLEASTVTRLADRLVAAGHVTRGSDPRHRGVVTLTLTPSGQRLVRQVEQWRRAELTRLLGQMPARERDAVIAALQVLVEAAGEEYWTAQHGPVPL